MTISIKANTNGSSGTILVGNTEAVKFDATGITQGVPFSFRNKLINGNMAVNQRVSGTGVAQGSFMTDRWFIAGGTSTYNWSQQAGPNEDLPYSLLVTKASGAVGYYICQRIEDVRTLGGKSVTLQFYIKSTSAVVLNQINLQQKFGTGGSALVDKVVISGGVITSTTSWQKVTGKVTLDSTVGKTVGTNSYLELSIGIPDTTAGIYITGVQLECGDVATPFEQRPYSLELLLSQRYYFRFLLRYYGYSPTGDAHFTTYVLPTTMRSTPTYTQLGTWTGINVYSAGFMPSTTSVTATIQPSVAGMCGYGNSSTSELALIAEL